MPPQSSRSGAFFYFRPAQDAAVEYPLSALKSQEARSLRIERAGAAPIVLERKQDAWFITAPFAARADASRVQQLLAIVEARAAHRLPAGDRGRFGLEQPEARIIVDGQPFGFGMVNNITREQYVMSGDAVYAVHPRYGAALPAERRPDGEPPAVRRSMKSPVRIALKDFAVEQREGKWTLAPALRRPQPGRPPALGGRVAARQRLARGAALRCKSAAMRSGSS